MLNHKPKEAVDGAFVRRLPTDVNDRASESGLAFEHNAHSVVVAYCILTNRSANMFVPCRKSVRRECGSSLRYRQIDCRAAICPRLFHWLSIAIHGLNTPSFMGVPGEKPSGLPFPIARSSNLPGTARHFGRCGRFLQLAIGA